LKGRALNRVHTAFPKLPLTWAVSGKDISRLRNNVHRLTEEALLHLRSGQRPSLAGTIPGLTPELERKFRAGQVIIEKFIIDGQEHIRWASPLSADCSSKGWGSLGFSGTEEEYKETALAVYDTWKKHEVGFGNPAFFVTDDSAAEFFNRDPRGIRTGGIYNINHARLLHFMELLDHVPAFVFKRRFIGTVESYIESGIPSFPGKYASGHARELPSFVLFPNSYHDRCFVTAFFLRELGTAVYDALDEVQKSDFDEMAADFIFREEWNRFDLFSGGFTPTLPSPDEKFADCFMHFRILERDRFTGQVLSNGFAAKMKAYNFLRSLYKLDI